MMLQRVIPTLALLATLAAPASPIDGYAAHYAPGLMERASRHRDLPLTDCMVASDLAPIGSWLRVVSQVTDEARVCRVTDVSHPRDRARHARQGLLIELDWPSAKAICGLRRVGERPWRACPVTVAPAEGPT